MKKLFNFYKNNFIKIYSYFKKISLDTKCNIFIIINTILLFTPIFLNNNILKINIYFIYFINLEIILFLRQNKKFLQLKNVYYIFDTNIFTISLLLIVLIYSNIIFIIFDLNKYTQFIWYFFQIILIIGIYFLSKRIKFSENLKI